MRHSAATHPDRARGRQVQPHRPQRVQDGILRNPRISSGPMPWLRWLRFIWWRRNPTVFSDLLCAVSIAGNLLKEAGDGEISMSWGSAEFAAETSFESVFTTPNVVYFASSGDNPGASYPSASPNVVSVGGTTLSTDAITG